MLKDEESSVDSELAALLDEQLFSEGGAAAAAEEPAADEAAAEEQQQHKRPRWAGRTPEPIELDDDDKAFLEEVGCDQGSSESDLNAEQQHAGQQGMQDTAGYVCPPHPGWWMKMCIRCGATRPEADPTDAGAAAANKAALTRIKHLHHKQALEVAPHEAARIANDGLQRLIAQKRLVLVLDLDHTLLNTVRDIDLVGPEREAAIRQLEAQHRALQEQLQQQQQQQQQGQSGMAGTEGSSALGTSQPSQQQQQQQQQEGTEQDEADPWDDPPSSAAAAAAPAAADAAGNGTTAAAAAAAAAGIGTSAAAGVDADSINAASTAAAAAAGSADPDTMESDTVPGQQQQQQEMPSSAAAAAAAAGAVEQQQQQQSSNSRGSRPAGFGPQAQLYWFRDKGLWTKLRPGVAEFLSAVSQLYELHIYTMGDKGYAGLMADILDPEHRLFVGRVISAADSTRAGVKDLDVLLADESLVLILDDTEHVWENHRANLIQVERYHYFGASARLFHPDAASPLEQGTDEPEQGGMLDNAAQLLERIHARVYGTQQQQQQQQQSQPSQQQQQQQDVAVQDDQQQQQQQSLPGIRRVRRVQPAAAAAAGTAAAGSNGGGQALPQHGDVRECLEQERRRVLEGCSIVFSRCWPQQQDPAAHPLWQLAVRLGAKCGLKLEPGVTTHLIVAPDADQAPGSVPFTDKVQAAQKRGIPVVHPDWLLACRFAWRALPAADFSLKSYVSTPGSSCCSRRWLGLARSGAGGASRAEREAVMKGAGRTGS